MRIWRIIVSALLIVLVLSVTVGMVCHNHEQCSASNCTLCHLLIAPPAPGIAPIGLVPVTAEYPVWENRSDSRYITSEKPPRAPPV